MAQKIIEIEHVPQDIDSTKIARVTNPLIIPVPVYYNRSMRKEPFILEPGKTYEYPLPIAMHIAKHIAEKIVFRKKAIEERKIATKTAPGANGQLISYVDEKVLYLEQRKAIQNFGAKVWAEMKKIVTSDEPWIQGDDAQKRALGFQEVAGEERPIEEFAILPEEVESDEAPSAPVEVKESEVQRSFQAEPVNEVPEHNTPVAPVEEPKDLPPFEPSEGTETAETISEGKVEGVSPTLKP